MDAPLLLTVDELRALDRILDLTLPRFVTADDTRDLGVDTAALRGLAARGLVAFEGDITLSPALARHLAPCRPATLVAEVEIETAGARRSGSCGGVAGQSGTAGVVTQHAVLAAAGPTALFTGERGGLARLALLDTHAHDVVLGLCRLDTTVRQRGGERFTVDTEAYAEASDQILAGDPGGAAATFVAGGAPYDAARAWIDAVLRRRVAVALRVARNLGTGPGGPFEAAELRWLVADDGTVWQISAVPSGVPVPGPGWADEEPPARNELAQVGPAEVLSAVRAALMGERADAA